MPSPASGAHGGQRGRGSGSEWFGTHLDAGVGQSGGLIFYFPGGGTSGSHFVFAVASRARFSGSNRYVGGPKVREISDFIIAAND